jgi:hypothetical protein
MGCRRELYAKHYIRQPTENLSATIFTTIEEAKAYILTGDATLTPESRRSPDLYFVSLFIGDSADDGQFKYLGIINRNGFRITINSRGKCGRSIGKSL